MAETFWDSTPGPRTVWDRDLAGAGTETRWDVLSDILSYSVLVQWQTPLHTVMWGRQQSMALVGCDVIYAQNGSLLGEPLDPKAVAESIRVAFDMEQPVDCDGQGNTITVSQWAVNAADDDGALTLDQPATVGYEVSVRVTGGTDGVVYGLVNTITTSDGRTLIREARLPIGIVTNDSIH